MVLGEGDFMPRKPKYKVSKKDQSFRGTLVFRFASGRRRGELADEIFYDRKAYGGKGGWRSMFSRGSKRSSSLFRRK